MSAPRKRPKPEAKPQHVNVVITNGEGVLLNKITIDVGDLVHAIRKIRKPSPLHAAGFLRALDEMTEGVRDEITAAVQRVLQGGDV